MCVILSTVVLFSIAVDDVIGSVIEDIVGKFVEFKLLHNIATCTWVYIKSYWQLCVSTFYEVFVLSLSC